MSKQFFLFLALVISSVNSLLAAGTELTKGIPLEGTNVITHTPKGWDHATYIYSSIPSVGFSIPLARYEGAHDGDTSFTLSLISDHLKVSSLSKYIKFLKINNRSGRRISPYHFKIGQRSAIAIISRGAKIVDFTNGSGMNVAMAYEEVALQDGNRIYSCSLSTTPEKYRLYKGTAVKLCMALRFSTSNFPSDK